MKGKTGEALSVANLHPIHLHQPTPPAAFLPSPQPHAAAISPQPSPAHRTPPSVLHLLQPPATSLSFSPQPAIFPHASSQQDRSLTLTLTLTRAFEFPLLMEGQDLEDPKQSTADMTAFVQNLLVQMQNRFQAMSENIVSKIDEMGNRIDELEQSINDLKTELGTESTPTKAKPEESKPSDD